MYKKNYDDNIHKSEAKRTDRHTNTDNQNMTGL